MIHVHELVVMWCSVTSGNSSKRGWIFRNRASGESGGFNLTAGPADCQQYQCEKKNHTHNETNKWKRKSDSELCTISPPPAFILIGRTCHHTCGWKVWREDGKSWRKRGRDGREGGNERKCNKIKKMLHRWHSRANKPIRFCSWAHLLLFYFSCSVFNVKKKLMRIFINTLKKAKFQLNAAHRSSIWDPFCLNAASAVS